MIILGLFFALFSILLVFQSDGYDRWVRSAGQENFEPSSIDTTRRDIIPGNILDRNGTVLCDFSNYAETQVGIYIDNKLYSPLFDIMRENEDISEGLIGKYYNVLRDDSDCFRGRDIVLTIDHRLQKRVYDALSDYMGEDKKGSALVIDAETGEMLACVDFPVFDVKSPEDQKTHYFYSRNDMIYPGSTFKLLTSIMLLENNEDDVLKSDQPFYYGNTLINNSYKSENKKINYFLALERSSNTFFAKAMIDTEDAVKKMTDIAHRIDIGNELYLDYGKTASEWKLDDMPENHNKQQKEFHTVSTGYGQGYVQLSATHDLMIGAAIINGGKLTQPHMIKSVKDCFGHEENLDEVSKKHGDIKGLSSEHKVYELTDSETAEKLHEAMINNNNKFLENKEKPLVGIKTGTAQIGDSDFQEVSWILSNAEIGGRKYAVVINIFPTQPDDMMKEKLKTSMNKIYDAIEDCFNGTAGSESSHDDEAVKKYLETISLKALYE